VRRGRPQQGSAFAEVSRPGKNEPHEHAQRDCADTEKCRELLIRNQGLGFAGARHVQRIEASKSRKGSRFLGVAFGECHEALLEFGKHVFGLASCAAAVERDEG